MSRRVIAACSVPVVTYSIHDKRADVWAESMQLTAWETEVRLGPTWPQLRA
jgi:hypothetical protein